MLLTSQVPWTEAIGKRTKSGRLCKVGLYALLYFPAGGNGFGGKRVP
jgi:hypothetical protein